MTLPHCSTEATAVLLSAWMLDIAWQGRLFARYCVRSLAMAMLYTSAMACRIPVAITWTYNDLSPRTLKAQRRQ